METIGMIDDKGESVAKMKTIGMIDHRGESVLEHSP
jgi:hypothetical protein